MRFVSVKAQQMKCIRIQIFVSVSAYAFIARVVRFVCVTRNNSFRRKTHNYLILKNKVIFVAPIRQ
jgi:hypothetical protein